MLQTCHHFTRRKWYIGTDIDFFSDQTYVKAVDSVQIFFSDQTCVKAVDSVL
jgi:hypothetical protein